MAWLATKMADATVCFSGSSAEEIEDAKRFWQSIYPTVKPKSALVVKGIDQRLRTAPKPQNGEGKNDVLFPGLLLSGRGVVYKRKSLDLMLFSCRHKLRTSKYYRIRIYRGGTRYFIYINIQIL